MSWNFTIPTVAFRMASKSWHILISILFFAPNSSFHFFLKAWIFFYIYFSSASLHPDSLLHTLIIIFHIFFPQILPMIVAQLLNKITSPQRSINVIVLNQLHIQLLEAITIKICTSVSNLSCPVKSIRNIYHRHLLHFMGGIQSIV